MSFQTLINYLRFTKRAEEAEAKSKHHLAVAIDKNYKPNSPLHEENVILVSKAAIQQQNNYKNISHLIADDLYFVEVAQNQYKYYIKREQIINGNTVIEYSQVTTIITNVWETLANQTLYKVTLNAVPNLYYNEVSNTIIEVYLTEAFVFSDTFKYHPDDISEVTDGEYILDFKDADGFTNLGIDYFLKRLANSNSEILKSEKRRTVNFIKNTRPGIITSFPRITQQGNKFILQYNYYAKGIPAQSFLLDRALYLEFTYIGAMMAFLNETIFYTLTKRSDFEGHKHRDPFLTAYLDLIKDRIYHASLTEALEILFFAPAFAIQELRTDFLWHIIDNTLTGSLTNFQGIDKEDIVLKVIEVLAQKENLKEKILQQLLVKHPSGKTRLELLYDKINGENNEKFLKLIWIIWKESKYSNINPEKNNIISENSPVILDYRSDKTMGFHHDNASIDWNAKTNTIDVNIEVGTGEIEIYQGKDPNGGFTTKTKEKTEKHHYNYHPFSPMVIFNADNPSFIFKDEEQDESPYMVLPAFILLARENKAFWNNWLTSGEYFIDIITTVSGVANVLKVGRLYKILKVGKTVVGSTKTFTKAVTLAKGVAGVAEISSGSMNILLKLTGMADTEIGKEISKYLFYFEMMSLSSELSVALYGKLQKSARKILAQEKLLRESVSNVDEIKQVDEVVDELNKIIGIRRSIKTGSGGFLKYQKIISRNMNRQEEWMSCAAACIKKYAGDLGIKITESEVRILAKTTENGTDGRDLYFAMVRIFKDKNVFAKSYFENMDDFKNFETMLKDSNAKSFITNVGFPPNKHTIIVDQIIGKKVYIKDPWPLEVDEAYESGIRGDKLEEIFNKSNCGVEAIIDLDYFRKLWIEGGNIMFKIK